MALRPTPNRLREALFNVLAPRISGAIFLDAYAGSGAVGIEALSRGASSAIFIEKNYAAVRVIRENLAALGVQDKARIIHAAARPAIARMEAGIVFIDPPYALTGEYAATLEILAAPLVLAQHASRVELPERPGKLRRTRVLVHGDNAISFFEPLGKQAAGGISFS